MLCQPPKNLWPLPRRPTIPSTEVISFSRQLFVYNFDFTKFFLQISGNESFSETLSADSSMEHTKKEDTIKQPQESEQKIVDLITDSKWIEAVQAYKVHKIRWPGKQNNYRSDDTRILCHFTKFFVVYKK